MLDIQQELAAAQRIVWNQGVPQKYELTSNERTNPDPTNPFTFWKGQYQWDAMARAAKRSGDIRLKQYGYAPDDGQGPVDYQPAAPQAPKHSTGEMIQRGGQMLKEGAQKAGEVAGQVADAVSPAAKSFQVQVLGPDGTWSKVRTIGEEAYRNAVKQLGVQKIRLVQ
jgi:hypothetical protein